MFLDLLNKQQYKTCDTLLSNGRSEKWWKIAANIRWFHVHEWRLPDREWILYRRIYTEVNWREWKCETTHNLYLLLDIDYVRNGANTFGLHKICTIWWMFTCHGIAVAWSTYFPLLSIHSPSRSVRYKHANCLNERRNRIESEEQWQSGKEGEKSHIITQFKSHWLQSRKPQKATKTNCNAISSGKSNTISRNCLHSPGFLHSSKRSRIEMK